MSALTKRTSAATIACAVQFVLFSSCMTPAEGNRKAREQAPAPAAGPGSHMKQSDRAKVILAEDLKPCWFREEWTKPVIEAIQGARPEPRTLPNFGPVSIEVVFTRSSQAVPARITVKPRPDLFDFEYRRKHPRARHAKGPMKGEVSVEVDGESYSVVSPLGGKHLIRCVLRVDLPQEMVTRYVDGFIMDRTVLDFDTATGRGTILNGTKVLATVTRVGDATGFPAKKAVN